MIQKISLFLFVLLLSACGGFDFVYEDYKKKNFLISNTSIYTFGDNNILLKKHLTEKLVSTNDSNIYALSASSIEKSNNLFIQDSKFVICSFKSYF